MKTRFAPATLIAALITALSQPVFAGDAYWALVNDSFDAMLTHQPYAGPTAATVVRGEPDPAEALIHARLRGESKVVPAQASAAQDQVAASFARMLAHEPYYGPTAVGVARGETDAAEAIIHARLQGDSKCARRESDRVAGL